MHLLYRFRSKNNEERKKERNFFCGIFGVKTLTVSVYSMHSVVSLAKI